jgi:nucleoid-associated protein YgaU
MGLLDFAKDVGRQIFDTDAEAADNIKEFLQIRTYGITNIEVDFDDGVATICGDCINQATRDNAVLMVGNIKGVEKVVADDLRVSAPAEAPAAPAPDPAPDPATTAPAAAASKPAGADAPAEPPVAVADEKYEVYEIVGGDTLGKIAQHYYGKASAYMRIFEANRGIIENPDQIFPGQKIRIPLD